MNVKRILSSLFVTFVLVSLFVVPMLVSANDSIPQAVADIINTVYVAPRPETFGGHTFSVNANNQNRLDVEAPNGGAYKDFASRVLGYVSNTNSRVIVITQGGLFNLSLNDTGVEVVNSHVNEGNFAPVGNYNLAYMGEGCIAAWDSISDVGYSPSMTPLYVNWTDEGAFYRVETDCRLPYNELREATISLFTFGYPVEEDVDGDEGGECEPLTAQQIADGFTLDEAKPCYDLTVGEETVTIVNESAGWYVDGENVITADLPDGVHAYPSGEAGILLAYVAP